MKIESDKVRRIKVFYPLLWFYPSQSGGPANTIYWMIKELDKHNFSCSVLSTNHGLPNDFVKENYDFGVNNEVDFISTIKGFFSKKSLNKIKECDIVHFSSLFFPPTLFLILYALIKNKKIIISPRGELFDSALSIKPLRKILWLFIVKMISSKISFHATSQDEVSVINKKIPNAKNIVLIPNFMELPELEEKINMNNYLYLGRINPIKNIDLIIKAINHLKESKKLIINLIIAGDSLLAYEEKYKKYIIDLINEFKLENQIEMIGHVEGIEKQKLLANSKALILPSKSENFGNVILESIAQKSPVIVSKNTPWQIVESYGAGYWIDSNIVELAEAIHNIDSLNEIEYTSLCNNAYKLSKEKFDIKHNISNWINYYSEINNNEN